MRHDQLARHLRPPRHLQRRRQRRAGTDADGDSLLPREPARPCEALVVRDLDDLVGEAHVHDRRHEAGADALQRVQPRSAAGQHGARLRLHRHHAQAGPARLQRLRAAGERAAGADAGDDRVHLAVGVVPDLLGGRAAMDRRVGGVAELVRDHRAGRLRQQFLRPRDRAAHALLARRQHQLRAQMAQHLAPLDRDQFRHGQDHPVAARRRRRRRARCRCCRRSAR